MQSFDSHAFCDSQAKSYHNASWDPWTDLELRNEEKGYELTCTGYAATRQRRCHNPINQHNRALAGRIVQQLGCINPSTSDVLPLLNELARATLCLRWHQDQAAGVAKKWRQIVDRKFKTKHCSIADTSYKSYGSKSNQSSRTGDYGGQRSSTSSKTEDSDPKATSTEREKHPKASEASSSFKDTKDYGIHIKEEELDTYIESLLALAGRLRSEKEKMRAESEREKAKERRRQEEEQCRKDEEHRRKEEEQRQREQRAAEERAHQEKNKREQGKARKLREEQERKEWEASWDRYIHAWKKFDGKNNF